LLLKANHAGKKIIWNNKEIELQPGQLITGRIKLASETGIKENTVQYILKFFENSSMIQQRNNSQNRIITILSWNDFQKFNNELTTAQQRINNGLTTAQQRNNTNNNVKNEKNEKNEKKIKSEGEKILNFDFVFEKIKTKFIEYIETKKNKPTQKQLEAIYEHLIEISEKNTPRAQKILEQSIRNGWQDLYILDNQKTKTNGNKPNNLSNLRAAASNIIQAATGTAINE
jgi:predicted transcriptional regulator